MEKTYSIGRIIMGRLRRGEDVITGLLKVAKKHGLNMALVSAIGALERVRFSYYDQNGKFYRDPISEDEVEVLSISGNLSIKDGEPFLHLHVVASKGERVIGGHLLDGSIVFALEYKIVELIGDPLVRKYDDDTGLFLFS